MRKQRAAADRGHANAQGSLGIMYQNGWGVTQNDAEALRWYRLAADQGNATAQRWLGSMYENGRGVTQSLDEAARWYRLAADQGNEGTKRGLAWIDPGYARARASRDAVGRTDEAGAFSSSPLAHRRGAVVDSVLWWIGFE